MEVTILIIIRGVISILIVLVGFYSIKKGAELYIRGINDSESLSIEAKKGPIGINLSLKKIGSVMMLTSVIWVFIAYLTMPKEVTITSSNGQSSVNSETAKSQKLNSVEVTGNVNMDVLQ